MTKTSNYGLYAVAAAVLVVGVAAFEVPLGSLAIIGLVLACPLMMIFMMRGMRGRDTRESGSQSRSDDLREK